MHLTLWLKFKTSKNYEAVHIVDATGKAVQRLPNRGKISGAIGGDWPSLQGRVLDGQANDDLTWFTDATVVQCL